MRRSGYAILALAALGLICISGGHTPLATETSPVLATKDKKQESKVSSQIGKVVERMKSMGMTRGNVGEYSPETLSTPTVRVDRSGAIQAYIYLDEVGEEHLSRLGDHGVKIEIASGKYNVVQGWIPFEAIEAVAREDFVIKITPPSYGELRTGAVTSEGDAVVGADEVRGQLGFTGTGVRVGVISDGVDDIASAQATGDLPEDIAIGSPGSGNEGTAVLEMIHDIAPGASLAFSEGLSSSLAFIDSIDFLLNTAQVDIIMDDIGFLTEPYFEDGMVAEEARDAVTQGVVFITAAGNAADEHYQALYVDTDPTDNSETIGFPADDHDFGLAAGMESDTGWRFAVPPSSNVGVILQWNDPFGGSGNDYDLFLTNVSEGGSVVDTSLAPQDGDDDPIEAVTAQNSTSDFVQFALFINRFSGEPRILEVYFRGPVIIVEDQFNVPQDSVFGHPAVPSVLASGAVPWFDPDTIEDFSSHGPATIFFPTEETRDKPDVVAPDGVSVTGAGGFPDTFFGTSASAAHVAGVAALILEANPSLTPADVAGAITTTATEIPAGEPASLARAAAPIELSQFNSASGFGLVNAPLAVQSVIPTSTPSPPPSPSPSQSDGGDGGGCSLAAAGSPFSPSPYTLLLTVAVGLRAMRRRLRRRG